MAKIQLVDIQAFKTYAKKPVKVDIGEEIEAFIRRVSMNEFFEIQEIFKSAEPAKAVDEGAGVEEDVKLRENLTKQFNAIAEVMTRVVTKEDGTLAYGKEVIPELAEHMNPKFVGDFIKAFMVAQGISEETPAKAESSFPAKS